MLTLSQSQLESFRSSAQTDWLNRHVQDLRIHMPDIACLYTEDDFELLVVRVLKRSDRLGLHRYDASFAFAYASLGLGIGFEREDPTDWVTSMQASPPDGQAEIIWSELKKRLAKQSEELG